MIQDLTLAYVAMSNEQNMDLLTSFGSASLGEDLACQPESSVPDSLTRKVESHS